MLALLALGVKLTSPGPVLFRQARSGRDGHSIGVFKFRTMSVSENGSSVRQATKNDARITRFGAFLRRTSLDELPQFVNVLLGHMSVVGPRPHAVAHNQHYRTQILEYMLRHKVRPGITGWAQVNGFRGETDTVDKMVQRVSHDLEYIRRWSMGLDLRIVWLTGSGAACARTPTEPAVRRFVLIGQTASASGDFSVEDLPGSSGRLDVLLRCVRAALLFSHGLRSNVLVYLVLRGGATAARLVRIDGRTAKFLRPDERSLATLIKKTLQAVPPLARPFRKCGRASRCAQVTCPRSWPRSARHRASCSTKPAATCASEPSPATTRGSSSAIT